MKINRQLYRKWLYNYKVKLFSLLSAFFLWFYVVTDNQFEHTLDIPLRLINKPKGWILTQSVPHKVKVKFRGVGKTFLSFRLRNRRIELDLNQVKQAATFPIITNMIKGIPSGMNIEPLQIIEPESVTVRLDLFTSRKVAIRPDIKMIPMDGYIQVGDIYLEHDSLIVSGPKSLVRAVSEVFTERKEYRNVLKEIQAKVSLVPPEISTLKYSMNKVKFRADIQRIGERIIKEIPVQVSHVPKDVKATAVPSTITLKLQGGVDILSKLKKEEISAAIDFRSRSRYKGKRLPATIKVPRDISFSDVKPQFFELMVER